MGKISTKYQGAMRGYTFRDTPRKEDRDHVRSLLESTGIFYPREIGVAVELIEDGLRKGTASDYAFIFIDSGNETVGYICYGPITMTDGRFDIYWIVVQKKLQRTGMGYLLLHEAEKRIIEHGGRYLFIETSSRDAYKPTREFYRKNGCREVARIPSYYADGDDKIVFGKHLVPQSF